ncbi:MAG TPA: hypothetical protein VFB50_15995 [Chloroflexota bacterium]|nr:hypothetical protein [Chloroflexota bacterium]
MAPSNVAVWDISESDPPGGSGAWQQDGYDDSAWPRGVAPTFQNVGYFDPSSAAPTITRTGYGLGDPATNAGAYVDLPRPQAFAFIATPQAMQALHPVGTTMRFAWRFKYDMPAGNWVLGMVETWAWSVNPTVTLALPVMTWLPNLIYPDLTTANAYGSVWFYPWINVDQGATTLVTPGLLVGTLVWDGSLGYLDFWRTSRLVFFQLDGLPSGSVAAWGTPTLGASDVGAMGTGIANSPSYTPVLTLAPSNTAKVVSNGKTTIFLTADGKLYGCGDNSQGMLGIGTTDSSDHSTPIRLGTVGTGGGVYAGVNDFDSAGVAFHDVSIGGDCVLALDRGGHVYGWGPNALGSLGRYNYTAGVVQPTPTTVGLTSSSSEIIALSISTGKNFSVVASMTTNSGTNKTNLLYASGDNTYGQFGNGTTTSATNWTASYATPIYASLVYVAAQLSCGEDVTWLLFGRVYGAGRGEWGNLGWDVYGTSGVGIHKIQSTFHNDSNTLGATQVEPIGPLVFMLTAGPGAAAAIGVWGDGTPYGGDGSNAWNGYLTVGTPPATRIWGQQDSGPSFLNQIEGEVIIGSSFGSFDPNNVYLPFLQPVTGIASSGGGSTNPYSLGASQVAYAAWGFRTPTTGSSDIGPSDGLLYTWGWGGAGQMGNGLTAATNIKPISQNGLTSVIGACFTAGIAFAISGGIGPARAVSRGLSRVQVIT